ncbi:hypothetical protein T12_15122 [Trichinella patagoniensis]|uniref:Uncharacterized protein n=1 Tax=Trichinella patagoniensis TaxID=990121 RepID=A0A0V0ZVS1_9BILA|nr:hypothetical protein T12_15122 [Trichinella patagoniensis]
MFRESTSVGTIIVDSSGDGGCGGFGDWLFVCKLEK